MKISRSKLSVLGCVALASLGVFLSIKPADSTELSWDWSYKCSLLITQTKCEGGSGTFTTTDQQGSGERAYYLVTDITGTVEGNTITSLVAPDSLGEENDNKLFAPGGHPFLNGPGKVTGIAFLTNNDSATHENVNLLYSLYIDYAVGYDTQISGPNGLALESVEFSSTQVSAAGDTSVPEPSSFLIYVTMAILLVGTILKVRQGRI